MEEIKNIDKAIILIGSTGSGKSTLANTLAGKQLIIKSSSFDEDTAVIELAEGEDGAAIGHSIAVSETSVPELMINGNECYIDCPGFGDTKSVE